MGGFRWVSIYVSLFGLAQYGSIFRKVVSDSLRESQVLVLELRQKDEPMYMEVEADSISANTWAL